VGNNQESLKSEVLEAVKYLPGRTLGWDEAAVYLGCTPGTLKVWVSKRKVPYCKVGRLTRFRIPDLDRFLTKNSVSPKVG
jgi:excisionase family DNA binding protein